ncbi:MAG: penicillin-binding protein activator LpoB [Desulfobacterales bacterium]|nr:penicillin-binding protein activator LpoB [Desulfobacterales bacterium]
MKKRIYLNFKKIILAIFICSFLYSCTVTTKDISPDDTLHYNEGYDFSDKNTIVKKIVSSLLTKPPLVVAEDRPVIIVYGVANRTDEHISTSNITDDIRTELMGSGRVRFISETQRENIASETGYQYGGAVSPETKIQKAQQIGAQYILTGTLRSMEKKQERQARLTKRVLKYYSLTMELTDITTGLISWTDNVEIVREASKPFIGW